MGTSSTRPSMEKLARQPGVPLNLVSRTSPGVRVKFCLGRILPLTIQKLSSGTGKMPNGTLTGTLLTETPALFSARSSNTKPPDIRGKKDRNAPFGWTSALNPFMVSLDLGVTEPKMKVESEAPIRAPSSG